MRASAIAVCSLFAFAVSAIPVAGQQQNQDQGNAKPKLYNTTKQKLLEGKQVFSFTQSKFDIAGYCATGRGTGVSGRHGSLNRRRFSSCFRSALAGVSFAAAIGETARVVALDERQCFQGRDTP